MKILRCYISGIKEGGHEMFELQPQTLDTEVARRREVLRGTMRASRGTERVERRVPGTVRIRHAVAMLAATRA